MKYGVFLRRQPPSCFQPAVDKGDLYLPKEGDKARFGVVQTGLKIHSSKELTNQTND